MKWVLLTVYLHTYNSGSSNRAVFFQFAAVITAGITKRFEIIAEKNVTFTEEVYFPGLCQKCTRYS